MRLKINGREQYLSNIYSLKEYVDNEDVDLEWAAVALNGIFVPKSQYEVTMLSDGDEIEILQPAQGG